MTPEQRTRRKTIKKLWRICRPVRQVPDPRIREYREGLAALRGQWDQVRRITGRLEVNLRFGQFPSNLCRTLYDQLSKLTSMANYTRNQSATWLDPPRALPEIPTVWTYDAFRQLVADWDVFEREYHPTWDGPVAVITLGPWDMTNPLRPSDGPITIGPLRVRIDLSHMAEVRVHAAPGCRVYHGRCHPHVADGHFCWGDGRLIGPRALANGRLVEGIDMLDAALSEYNPDSPSVGLERFGGFHDRCPFCEEEMDEETRFTCSDCGVVMCASCAVTCDCCDHVSCPDHDTLVECHYSGRPLCSDCQHTCHVCEYTFAADYGERCPDCHRWVCHNCGLVCADCGESVCDECGQDTDDGPLCRSCYEAREGDGEEAVSPPRIRVDETATPILPGLAVMDVNLGDPPF